MLCLAMGRAMGYVDPVSHGAMTSPRSPKGSEAIGDISPSANVSVATEDDDGTAARAFLMLASLTTPGTAPF